MSVADTEVELDFGERGALRERVGESGRVHLDRWLPFLVVHRGEAVSGSLARRVAVNSPAYLVATPGDEAITAPLIELIVAAIAERLGVATR